MAKVKAILASSLVLSTILLSGCVVDPFGFDRPHHPDRNGYGYDRDRGGRGYDHNRRPDRDGQYNRYNHRQDNPWNYNGR